MPSDQAGVFMRKCRVSLYVFCYLKERSNPTIHASSTTCNKVCLMGRCAWGPRSLEASKQWSAMSIGQLFLSTRVNLTEYHCQMLERTNLRGPCEVSLCLLQDVEVGIKEQSSKIEDAIN